MEKRSKTIRLQNKATAEVKVLELIQRDSIQGFWCVDVQENEELNNWTWYPHEKWTEIK